MSNHAVWCATASRLEAFLFALPLRDLRHFLVGLPLRYLRPMGESLRYRAFARKKEVSGFPLSLIPAFRYEVRGSLADARLLHVITDLVQQANIRETATRFLDWYRGYSDSTRA